MELLNETSLFPAKLEKNGFLALFNFVQKNKVVSVSNLKVNSQVDLNQPFSLQLYNKVSAVVIHVNANFDNQIQTATSVGDQNFQLQKVANLLPSQLSVKDWRSNNAFW